MYTIFVWDVSFLCWLAVLCTINQKVIHAWQPYIITLALGFRFLDWLTCCPCKDVPMVVNGVVFRLELVWFRVGWWKTTELLRPLHFLRAWMTKMDGPAVADGSGSMPDGINSLSGVDVNVLWEPFGLIWFCSLCLFKLRCKMKGPFYWFTLQSFA